jgi:GNAT superfamily N-acetyltransferase
VLFADLALAQRIESAEASLSQEVGRVVLHAGLAPDAFVEDIVGGVAVFVGSGSPVNKVIGIGFVAPPVGDRFAEIENLFASRGAHVQAEVSTLADPAWHTAFSQRGYHLAGFEHVLGLDLVDLRESTGFGCVTISVCFSADARTWLDAVATGFQHPDDVPAQAAGQEYSTDVIERTFESLSAATGFRRYLASVDGSVAGGASLRVCQGVAQLCGAATLPQYRRRGVQSALLDARLRDARSLGCDIAVVTTAPGSKSQQNAQRHGFALLYARALHILRPAP